MLALSATLSVVSGACAEEAAPVATDETAQPAAGDTAPPAGEAAAPPAPSSPTSGSPAAPAATELQFQKFDDMGFIKARKSGMPIVLYFEADWCGPCHKMHEKTFREPSVLEAAAGIQLFRVDMSKPDLYVDLVKKSFHVEGAPTLILFFPGGKESARRFGFIPAKEFTKLLGEARRPPAAS